TERLLFGHGTSSSYDVVSAIAGSAITDPNRAAHNEWLRAVYEWGLLGLALWTAFVFTAIRWVAARVERSTVPMLAYGAGVLAATLVENVLASAGTGLGVGIALAVATFASGKIVPGVARAHRYRLWRSGEYAAARMTVG